jgi:glycosyltransferase involved in cell wall biosynthesis
MKIRYLINNAFASGGTVRTTLNMANGLSARGHDVELVSMRRLVADPLYRIDPAVRVRTLVDEAGPTPPGWLAQRRNSVRQTMIHKPSRLAHPEDSRYDTFNLYGDIRLVRFLRSVHDGVLIGTRPSLNLAIARYARRSVIRVGQEHVHLSRHEPGLRAAILRHYPRLDALTALTPSDAAEYQALLGSTQRVIAVPNAAPDMGGVRAQLDNKVVIAAGRMTAAKGFGLLVRAFAKVVAVHPDWRLHIFGTGTRHEALQERIDARGLGGNILLKGFTTQLPAEMGNASIYALSSRFEGFPMVLLEAMMCGLPAVAFDCPTGPRDLIDHGKDGLLVAHLDVAALAAGIIELIEDPARRKALGAAAYAKAQQYSTPALAQRWEELLAELAAQRGIRV